MVSGNAAAVLIASVGQQMALPHFAGTVGQVHLADWSYGECGIVQFGSQPAMTETPKVVQLGSAVVTEWSDYALDRFVAPELSKFTAASIPEVSEYNESREWWVRNFFLNSMLRATPDPPYRQYMLNFLRRAELSFHQYELARERTLKYLESPRNRGTGHYMAAIGHWEVFLAQAWHAYLLLSYMAGLNGRGIFEPGDGSEGERLNFLYNRSKHAEKSINGAFYPEDSTLCLWLCNDGLKVTSSLRTDGHLTFFEVFGLLQDLGKWADRVQDPATLREKLVQDLGIPEAN